MSEAGSLIWQKLRAEQPLPDWMHAFRRFHRDQPPSYRAIWVRSSNMNKKKNPKIINQDKIHRQETLKKGPNLEASVVDLEINKQLCDFSFPYWIFANIKSIWAKNWTFSRFKKIFFANVFYSIIRSLNPIDIL